MTTTPLPPGTRWRLRAASRPAPQGTGAGEGAEALRGCLQRLTRCEHSSRARRRLAALGCVMWISACRDPAVPVGRLQLGPGELHLAHGRCATVRLAWQPTAQLDRRHGRERAFLHLLEDEHRLVRTFDHPLPRPWSPGEPQAYELEICQSVLAAALPPGRYALSGGLYDDAWGYRWPLIVEGPEIGPREYRLATVNVAASEGPELTLTGSWGPAEAVGDSQVVTRRWLAGDGGLVVSGITGRGEVLFTAVVPQPGPAEVLLGSTCGLVPTGSLLPGRHAVALGVPVAPPGPCTVAFRTASAGGRTGETARGLCLESLAWKPATQ